MNVLLIEDERKAANELKYLILTVKPAWHIIDIIPSVEEALEWFNENQMPDLIFSDIQLADAVSFKIFEQVSITCPIIFCTAYDEYAIKAFETNSIDYLLKPIDKTKLERALTKLEKIRSLFNQNKARDFNDINKLIRQISAPANKPILIHHQEKITPVKYSDAAFFYYNNGVVSIKLNNGNMYFANITIDEIEKAADANLFYRANRQFLINRNAIQNIERFFARKLVIKMKINTPEIIVISKAKASDFLNWLKNGN